MRVAEVWCWFLEISRWASIQPTLEGVCMEKAAAASPMVLFDLHPLCSWQTRTCDMFSAAVPEVPLLTSVYYLPESAATRGVHLKLPRTTQVQEILVGRSKCSRESHRARPHRHVACLSKHLHLSLMVHPRKEALERLCCLSHLWIYAATRER